MYPYHHKHFSYISGFFFGTAVAVIWQWVYFGAIGEFD
jgi:hypothetical protein